MNTRNPLRIFLVLLGSYTLACASAGLAPQAGDPTKAEADVAPLPGVASALEPDFDPLAQLTTSAAKSGQHDHSQHDHSQHDQAKDDHAQHDHAQHDHSQHGPPPQADAEPNAASYTCPMHPEVVRDAPGRCPICGMNLEPAKSPKSEDGSASDAATTPGDGH